MSAPGSIRVIGGFALALDRRYERMTHMWVRPGPDRVRIGMDALEVESSGTLAALSLPEPGFALTAGRPFGQVEAVKFVGPLVSPVTGTVLAANQAAAADPGLIERDPYGAGWLIEAELTDPAELDRLLAGEAELTQWYLARIAEYCESGVIAQ